MARREMSEAQKAAQEKFTEAGKPYRFTKENAAEYGRKGKEVQMANYYERKEHKADLHYLGEILGKYLLKPIKTGECYSVDDVEALSELEKKNTRAIEKGVENLVKRFIQGDKRAVTQVAEILASVTEAEDREEHNGFLEALNAATDDWGEENNE